MLLLCLTSFQYVLTRKYPFFSRKQCQILADRGQADHDPTDPLHSAFPRAGSVLGPLRTTYECDPVFDDPFKHRPSDL